MRPIALVFEHFEEGIHLGDGTLAKIEHMVGDATDLELPHLRPVVAELGIAVAPGDACTGSDESDWFAVIFDCVKIDPPCTLGVRLVFADVDSKCS